MNEQPSSKKLVDRLRGWYHNDDISTGDTVLLIGEAAGEIERLQRECSNWKQLHDNDEACIANLRASGAPKPPHLREPPHCSTCGCGLAPEPRSGRFSVQPTRCACHPETCCCPDFSLLDGEEVIAKSSHMEGLQRIADAANRQPACEHAWAKDDNGERYCMRCDAPTPPTKASAQPPGNVHGVIYDRAGWVCSVCHGWNHAQYSHCTHTHAASALTKEPEHG